MRYQGVPPATRWLADALSPYRLPKNGPGSASCDLPPSQVPQAAVCSGAQGPIGRHDAQSQNKRAPIHIGPTIGLDAIISLYTSWREAAIFPRGIGRSESTSPRALEG